MDRRSLLAAMAALPGLSLPSMAQGSQRRIVFPFAPGAGGDTLARLLADGLSTHLNDRVIVENKTGAGGRIGVMAVKTADPDGRTLLATPIAPISIYPLFDPKLSYDPFKDLAPVSQVSTFDFAVAVGKNVPARDLKQLVSWLKADQTRGNFGTPGAGTLPHFFAASFGKAAGIDLNHIAYRGSAAALADVMGDKLPMIFTTTSDLVQHHEAGNIRILATSGAARSPFIKNVPTFREAGFAIEGEGWYGVYAAAGTPAAELEKLSASLVATLKQPDVRDKLGKLGMVVTGTSPAELARIQKADFERWAEPVRASGFKAE